MTHVVFDVTLKVAICLDTSDESDDGKSYDIAISNIGAVGEAVCNTILEHLQTGPDNDTSIFLVDAIADAAGFCVANIGIEASVALALEPRQPNQQIALYDTVEKAND